MLLLPRLLGAQCICYSSRSQVLIVNTMIPMHLVSRTVLVLAGPRPAAMRLERDRAGQGVLRNLGRIRQQLGTTTC